MTTTDSGSAGKPVIPGRVSFLDGKGELPMLEVNTAWSSAEIYLHGAHVTDFQKHHEPPLLFLSQCSRFTDGQPIRGGVPLVFPWFGPREGQPMHGFARLKTWTLKEFVTSPDGSVSLRFRLPAVPEAAILPAFTADYTVTVSDSLTLELTVKNESASDSFTFENCFHTYFEVEDITAVSIAGLKGRTYVDRLANYARKEETADAIRIAAEVDRTYLDATGAMELHDSRLGRRILIEKEGSASTVVWNPWIAKAQQMPDFGNDEYQRMVCIESGNVGANQLTLPPGQTHTLKVRLSSQAAG
jgi:D-hexose-6-phosphate mutarotase